ncbi:MAG: hypothetical protein HYX25_03935 [Candidatus Solibacter usitatus]|nr:hypothetical protein [Candidatus Solibacter usitatus]
MKFFKLLFDEFLETKVFRREKFLSPDRLRSLGSVPPGADIKAQDQPNELDSVYAPFNKRVTAARAVIQPAVANRAQDSEAVQRRAVAQANASPLINRMGGVDKMSKMSEEEMKQAAAKAVGSYQQSLSGAPPGAGGGMQAMMQRLMSDPAYQARFEKMSKAEQEAELRKYTGPTPPPPAGPTAAERQAKLASTETAAVVATQKELGALLQRLGEIDAEFARKDQAILATPGGHDHIAKDVGARLEKVPATTIGEATVPDPAKVQVLQRELVTRQRTRAAFELQQRTAVFTQRRDRYKEVAAAYNTLLRRLGGVSSQTAQLLDDASVQAAVSCEERLIQASESLAKYSADVTSDAAHYERSYQSKMSEPLIKGK